MQVYKSDKFPSPETTAKQTKATANFTEEQLVLLG